MRIIFESQALILFRRTNICFGRGGKPYSYWYAKLDRVPSNRDGAAIAEFRGCDLNATMLKRIKELKLSAGITPSGESYIDCGDVTILAEIADVHTINSDCGTSVTAYRITPISIERARGLDEAIRKYHEMASSGYCKFPYDDVSLKPNYGEELVNVRELLTVEVEKNGNALVVRKHPIYIPWDTIRLLYQCVIQEDTSEPNSVRSPYGRCNCIRTGQLHDVRRSRGLNATSSILDMQRIFATFETNVQNYNYLAPLKYGQPYVGGICRPQSICCREYFERLREEENKIREKWDVRFGKEWENVLSVTETQIGNAKQTDVIELKNAYVKRRRFEEESQISDEIKNAIAKYIHSVKLNYYKDARRYIFAKKYAEALETHGILRRFGQDIKMYSTDTIGWTNFDYIISDTVRIKIQTNFGYGVASYFRIIFSYKGIPILPYSMYVNYYYARSRDLARYTRNYNLNLDRKCWELAFDFTVETSNMAISNPDTFVRGWVMHEVNDMIEGLQAIVNNPNSVMDKWLDKMGELGNESPYLHVRQMDCEAKAHYECCPDEMAIEFKAKKISGALDFLEGLAALKSIYGEVEIAIATIKSLAVKIVPEISGAIKSIAEDIANLKKLQAAWQKRQRKLRGRLSKMNVEIKLLVEEKIRHIEFLSSRELELRKVAITKDCQMKTPEYAAHVCALSQCDRKLSNISDDIALRNKFQDSLEQCRVRIQSDQRIRYMICSVSVCD